jgi:hypothetical protein
MRVLIELGVALLRVAECNLPFGFEVSQACLRGAA